jgi:hypothetical protein
MAAESEFVEIALAAAKKALRPPLSTRRGAALLYQVTVDNQLRLSVDPKHPSRGESAFRTDLCVFERTSSEVELPRVVLEFKTRITTHDVITYSAKSRKHKQVYPWLRCGIVASGETAAPRRFFIHNEGLDFFLALAATDPVGAEPLLTALLAEEVETSRLLESVAFGGARPTLYRTEVRLSSSPGSLAAEGELAQDRWG